ncbi:MAG: hypothetical protein COA79_04830 [Planctomycetota bacterium]|nr:MAG: hypothetical protein COA79_04830 [Planctomycetota bacterium]
MKMIQEDDVIFILVDYQEKLIPAISNAEKITSNIKILSEGLKILNIPIIVSEQYPQGLGSTVKDLNLGDIKSFSKTSFSVFDEPSLKSEINQTDRQQVILAGIESHICVLQTALQMKKHGFEVFIAEECIGSRTDENKTNALERLKANNISITNIESIFFEIMQDAKHPKFKDISKLIR